MVSMHATGGRLIQPELLDNIVGPDKQASLADLVRLGRYFGGHRILRNLIRRVTTPDEKFSLLDVGAASGDSGAIVRGVRHGAIVTSFDYRIEHLAQASYPKVTGDAFHLPFRDRSFDYVLCSLFLHHFENAAIVELLKNFRAVARRAVLVVDLERGPLAYYFMPMTQWLFGWNRITVHDGRLSVQAALKMEELHSLAIRAGLKNIDIRRQRPWARLTLVGQDEILRGGC